MVIKSSGLHGTLVAFPVKFRTYFAIEQLIMLSFCFLLVPGNILPVMLVNEKIFFSRRDKLIIT